MLTRSQTHSDGEAFLHGVAARWVTRLGRAAGATAHQGFLATSGILADDAPLTFETSTNLIAALIALSNAAGDHLAEVIAAAAVERLADAHLDDPDFRSLVSAVSIALRTDGLKALTTLIHDSQQDHPLAHLDVELDTVRKIEAAANEVSALTEAGHVVRAAERADLFLPQAQSVVAGLLDEPEAKAWLATGLVIAGNAFSQAGRHTDALNTTQNAVDLYQELAATNPTAYN